MQHSNLIENVGNLPQSRRPNIAINEVIALDIPIELKEFLQTSTIFLSLNYDISWRPVVIRILKRKKYHLCKPQLVQELLDGNYYHRIEFCDRVRKICNNANVLHRIFYFSMRLRFVWMVLMQKKPTSGHVHATLICTINFCMIMMRWTPGFMVFKQF